MAVGAESKANSGAWPFPLPTPGGLPYPAAEESAMPPDDLGYVLSRTVPEGPLTARNLADYVQCPRKFMLSFFSTPADTGQFIGGPAVLHRAVRAALIGFYAAEAGRRGAEEGGGRIGGLESPPHQGNGGLESPTYAGGESPTYAGAYEDVARVFEERWDGSLCKDSREEEDLHRDGLLMLQRHVEAFRAPAAQWRCDARMEAEFHGHRFVAVADVACEEPTRFLRFSTSRRPPSPSELREDLSWVLLYLVGRAQGDEAAIATMVDLRRARPVDYSLEPQERERMAARIAAIAGRIGQEREFSPVKSRQCRWCRSRAQCPLWQEG